MKKVFTFLTCLIGILFLKVFINFLCNEIIIYHYYQEKYDTTLIQSLYFMNIQEPYIAYYNHGNLLYQKEEYTEAIQKYEIALEKNPPQDKVCNIEINLSLAMLATVDTTKKEEALSILEKARTTLYKNNCAHSEDDNGNSQEAETLEKEIKELEEQLQKEEDNHSNQGDYDEDEESNDIDGIEEKLQEYHTQSQASREEDLEENSWNYEYYSGKRW